MTVHLVAVDYDPFASPELARAVPTTDAQREVWLADQLGREASLAFNESVTLKLSGNVQLQALQDALLALADRHESLRSTFSADGSSMLIAPRGALQARLADFGAHDAAGRADALARLVHDEVTTPFDLVAGPLVRATLATLAPAEHALVLTAHHIVCDGWSFGVIARELMALYGAFAAGRQGALPPADSFGDYVLAAEKPERARAAEADERYWVGVYDQSVPVLDLPADRPRRPQREFASRREDRRLEPATVEAARKLGAKNGASLFATLFTLFAALMARLANDSDVVVGVPSAGQASADMPNLVGHCVNLLPVRVHADLAQPVAALLRHGSTRVLDAYEHQHCTFGRLLSRLQVPRDAARLPLVSVQFNLDSAIAADELSQPELRAALSGNAREFENFDLFVNASQIDGAIQLECQYNRALFDAETVRRWLALYEAAIQRAAGDAQQPAAALFAATDDDLRRIEAWNATARFFAPPFTSQARVEHLVTAQAARTPQATAVVDDAGLLTYAELERRADALALALQAQGVGAGQLVGLACGRNRHLLVGLLGILRSGAGYVPLDPAFPADRLAHMRADAGLQWVVSEASVTLDFGAGDMSVLWADSVEAKDGAAPPQADAGAPAYVIYTSGSTGKPKGVVVPHRAVVNFLASMAREPGLSAGDRLVAVTTPSFDIAVLELLLPLAVGAQVILASRDTVIDGAALRALVERHAATAMQATPSGWRLLVDAGWRGGPGFKALVGGEALPADLARHLLERCAEVWNMYGPTETTVWSTCWRVREGEPVSIGAPIANTTVDVLDEARRPCPIGVPGEIWIGGDGVAAGYLNRAELTDERFVADAQRPGARLYRTGDRGRWRADGQLEHLGRLDTQVKVRGYRIELGEIEAVLAAHAGVERAVVVLREDAPGDVRIVAYVVGVEGATIQAPDGAALREHLRRALPEYMVPAHFVTLAQIPLLPNGKIDRAALPHPERDAAESDGLLPPRTALEAQVLALMEEVLHLPGLGVRDGFFAVGGHSLLAAKLTARLNAAFGLALPLRTLFEASTAEQLAAAIEAARAAPAPRRAPIEHVPGLAEAPLTVMQERIRFMERLHPGRVVYNTPSAHRLRGDFDRAAFESALRALVQRQPALRTVIVDGDDAADGGAVQRVLPQVPWHLPFTDLSATPATQREGELLRRMQAIIDEPMPLARAPLFRMALYRLAPEEHVFLFMPHHMVWDGWSFDLLYQEMAELLPATLEGRLPKLTPLPVDYLDFSLWHARWMQGDECAAQVQWWKKRYAAVEPPRPLPTDRARRAGMTGAGAVEWVHVDAALTERLRELARAHGATVNMLVLAVYAAMLGEAVEGRSLVLGVPMRGRLAEQVEPVMGFFNNLLPLHLRLDSALPLTAWLGQVKGELVQAFANEDVPFERLAAEPEFVALNQAAGLYQSLFSFQDARARPRRWGPLEHSSVLVMQKGATEDFGLWLMEVPGGLEGGINYNAELFDAATAVLFRERLLGLLKRVTEAPQRTLEALLAEPGGGSEAFKAWVERRRTPAAAGTNGAANPAANLAANGSADRAARDIASAVARAARTEAPVLDAAQARLARIWSELLGVPAAQIRASDNFFDLGGSSLLVMRAAEQSRSRLGLAIEPRRFVFESLAQLATTAPEPDPVSASLPAGPGGSRPGWLARVFGRSRGGS